MNKKGQALVEFVLILPVFLLILLTIYDFGMIFNAKNEIEAKSTDIVMAFNNGSNVEEINKLYKDFFIDVSSDDNYYKIVIRTSVNIVTPFLNRIFGDPYEIVIERYIPYD